MATAQVIVGSVVTAGLLEFHDPESAGSFVEIKSVPNGRVNESLCRAATDLMRSQQRSPPALPSAIEHTAKSTEPTGSRETVWTDVIRRSRDEFLVQREALTGLFECGCERDARGRRSGGGSLRRWTGSDRRVQPVDAGERRVWEERPVDQSRRRAREGETKTKKKEKGKGKKRE